MQFSPDGRRLLISDQECRACVWDIAGEKICWSGSYAKIAFAPDGATLVAEHNDLELLDAATGKVRSKLPPPENPGLGSNALVYSPEGDWIAVGRFDGTVYLYPTNGKPEISMRFTAVDPPRTVDPILDEIRFRQRPVSDLAFSRDGRWLCTGGTDGGLRDVGRSRRVPRYFG